jgi:ribosomal protein S18 acetylase RimI-like enzyme
MILDSGKPIGMITSYQLGKEYGNDWYIGEIYLDKKYRGQGLGRKIMEDEIRDHDSIRLNVYKSNEHAINLYKSLGFKVTEDSDGRYIMRLKNKKES